MKFYLKKSVDNSDNIIEQFEISLQELKFICHVLDIELTEDIINDENFNGIIMHAEDIYENYKNIIIAIRNNDIELLKSYSYFINEIKSEFK